MDSTVSLGNFGKDLGLMHELVLAGRKLGVGSDFFSKLAHNPMLFRRVIEMVKADTTSYSSELMDVSEIFTVMPDYRANLQAQRAACDFDTIVLRDKNQHLGSISHPVELPDVVDTRYMRIDNPKSIEKINSIIREAGKRPANIWELFSFARLYPDIQRSFVIIALGTPLRIDYTNYGRSLFPAIGGDSSCRSLKLTWWLLHMSEECRFLVTDI